MNDEFFTKAIQKDRYLKATRLANRFETEVRQELERIGDEAVEENYEQFVDGVEARWNNNRSPNAVISFARVDYVMKRVKSMENPENLKLNIALRWLDPDEYGHPNKEGAMSVASYKIKNATKQDHEQVKQKTKEENWGIQFCEDSFRNSPGVLYIPIGNAEEFNQASETLMTHFSEHCTMFGYLHE
jgi:hypothetical protein